MVDSILSIYEKSHLLLCKSRLVALSIISVALFFVLSIFSEPIFLVISVAIIFVFYRGSFPKPGEVSLAHNGVLFLDEFPEFKRSSLEVLRQPMEDREVVISRATGRYRFPAKFQLIAAANPCPCGYKNDPSKECRCSNAEIKRYRNKLSGPIIDRIDLVSYVSSVFPEDLSKMSSGEKSEHIRERVIKAVEIQKKRFKEIPITFNSEMTPSMIERFVKLENSAENALNTAAKKYSISARGYHRILKVSRTIADLEGSDIVKLKHIIEAVNFRLSDELYS